MALTLSRREKEALVFERTNRWSRIARPAQIEPEGDWLIWAIITGRGWGKTRTAGETITQWIRSGKVPRVHLVARTAGDARDTMVEGKKSGLIYIGERLHCRPNYEPSKRRLTWPNGAEATLFTADEPDVLRGPECAAWWADELASWRFLKETWDNLQFGARMGNNVRGIITSTPRPIRFLKDILARQTTYVTRGSTYENRDNLAASFIAEIEEQYAGTRIGRQEINGELLDDDPNALWKRADIDADRVLVAPCDMARIVVAVDPSCTDTGDEAGIIVAGKGVDGQYYVLCDASKQASPAVWAKAVIGAFQQWKADRIIYETNQGGQMVLATLATADPAIKAVCRGIHASRGKIVRAEPIAALAEQHRIHHVGCFGALEDELCTYTGEAGQKSPNRLDAYVYAISELSGRQAGTVSLG